MLNYRNKKLLKNDPLEYVRRMFLGFSYHPLAHKAFFAITIHLIIQEVLYIAAMCFSTKFVEQFFTMLATNTFALVVVIALGSQEKQFLASTNELLTFFWSLESAGEQMHNKIKHAMYISKIFININLILFISIALGFLPYKKIDYENSMHLYLVLLNKVNLPFPLHILLIVIYFGLLTLMVFSMTIYVNCIVYYVLHFKFQFDLLKVHFKMIGRENNEPVEMLVDNMDYQEDVYEKLCICNMQYIKLVEFCKKITNQLSGPIFYNILGCIQLEVAYLISAFMYFGFESPMGVYSIFLTSMVVTVEYFYYYQVLYDQIEEVLDSAGEVYWESWNTKNRKCLLLLMSNCIRPMYLTGLGFFQGNWQLLIWVIHKVVNMVSAIYLMSEQK